MSVCSSSHWELTMPLNHTRSGHAYILVNLTSHFKSTVAVFWSFTRNLMLIVCSSFVSSIFPTKLKLWKMSAENRLHTECIFTLVFLRKRWKFGERVNWKSYINILEGLIMVWCLFKIIFPCWYTKISVLSYLPCLFDSLIDLNHEI